MTENLNQEHRQKFGRLQKVLGENAPLVIGYSGGADSTMLLKAAFDADCRTIAATVDSAFLSETDRAESVQLARMIGARHILLSVDLLENPQVCENSPLRCYYCKHAAFSALLNLCGEFGFSGVADATNLDDEADYRPGMKALEELGIISPLRLAGFNKEDIRAVSKAMGLPTFDKPAAACLASRIPYGRKLSRQELLMVDAGEQILKREGFRQCRVRHHGETARIEVPYCEISRLTKPVLRERILRDIQKLGFRYVAADLQGYRTGSLNELL